MNFNIKYNARKWKYTSLSNGFYYNLNQNQLYLCFKFQFPEYYLMNYSDTVLSINISELYLIQIME